MNRPDADDLRKLIGKRLDLQGHSRLVLEVLDVDGQQPCLVLQSSEQVIQGDQWGEAQRRVPATSTIRVFTDEGRLHPALISLFPDA